MSVCVHCIYYYEYTNVCAYQHLTITIVHVQDFYIKQYIHVLEVLLDLLVIFAFFWTSMSVSKWVTCIVSCRCSYNVPIYLNIIPLRLRPGAFAVGLNRH